MTPIMNFVFAKNATTAVESVPFTNNRCDVIGVEISGTFTSAQVIFEGKVDLNSSEYTPVIGINLSDFSYGHTVNKKGIWEIDISALQLFRARIISVSGGDITILGRNVSTAN